MYRACTICEATCGVEVVTEGGGVRTIRGDRDDPFSRGFICPKAYGMKALQDDPDRLTKPLKRTASGFEEVSWDEALELAVGGLAAVRSEHGADAVAAYVGNPNAHSLHSMLYLPVLLKALGTKQIYSATSADQLPKMVSAALMFGGGMTIPIPDLDRTDYLLMLGANPLVSNGSLMTAPDVPGRLDAIRARGGRIVVLDPRRTETARAADEHHFIRPGSDAAFLLALCHVLEQEGLADAGRAGPYLRGYQQLRAVLERFAPERVEAFTGVSADTVRRIARELCAAPSAACYGRIGTTCQRFGTLASWAVDLVNILSGNLDRPGGVMFPTPAAVPGGARAPKRRPPKVARWTSRVHGLPEMFGELPVATLADEMLEPGDGRVRALLTVAGNPLVSAPGVDQLERAVRGLDFRVAVDFYLNETTRLADVILPPPAPLERDNYDIAFYRLSVRNVAKYSAAALAKPTEQPHEWEILLGLAKGLLGMASATLEQADDFVAKQFAEREIAPDGRWPGLTPEEALGAVAQRRGPARLLDLMLRSGARGDGFGRADGLTLGQLEQQPHGVDLGPLEPALPGVVETPDGAIDLLPERMALDLPRLERALDEAPAEAVLIGRRHLRSNNSWMHNLHALVKGKPRCTLLVHPDDARRWGLADGEPARVASDAGSVVAPVELSDELMPGVVSLPHGFGHDLDGVRMSVARANAGVNVNVVSDAAFRDDASGNAAFNGVPVRVTAHAREAP